MGFSNCTYNTKKAAEALGIDETTLVNALNANAYGGFARVWAVEDKGKYSTARISISKKDTETNTYSQEFSDGFVRLIGQAHNVMKGVHIEEKKGISVRIKSCDVKNIYIDKNGNVSRNPQYTIFSIDIVDDNYQKANANSVNNGSDDDFMKVSDSVKDELPFS